MITWVSCCFLKMSHGPYARHESSSSLWCGTMKRCLMHHSPPFHSLKEATLQIGTHAVTVSIDSLRLFHNLQLLAIVRNFVGRNDESLLIFRENGGWQGKKRLIQISYRWEECTIRQAGHMSISVNQKWLVIVLLIATFRSRLMG